jgi:hypothetical protein
MTAPEPAADPSPAGNPTEQTILETGSEYAGGANPILVKLPGSGQLEVSYTFPDQPAAAALLIHSDANDEPLQPGDQIYDSLPGDALYLSLAYPSQSIKLAWNYL